MNIWKLSMFTVNKAGKEWQFPMIQLYVPSVCISQLLNRNKNQGLPDISGKPLSWKVENKTNRKMQVGGKTVQEKEYIWKID